MTHISFATAKEIAHQHGACTEALDTLQPMCSWPEFWQHPSAPQWAYWYANRVLRGRWPEAESHIRQAPRWAYYYAYAILCGRWPEAEPYILQSPEYAYCYARHVIQGRWLEAEPTILQDPRWAYWYAYHVICGLREGTV